MAVRTRTATLGSGWSVFIAVPWSRGLWVRRCASPWPSRRSQGARRGGDHLAGGSGTSAQPRGNEFGESLNRPVLQRFHCACTAVHDLGGLRDGQPGQEPQHDTLTL